MLRGELPTRRQLPGSYWRQWSASAVSNLGDGINFAAMPLLALSITDDERLLSLTVFATLLPWLLLALPIGVAVDRFDRQVLMVGSNIARLALFALIAFAVVGDRLSIWGLLGLLLVIGACEVTFDSSAQAFLPMIVQPADLQRANGYLVGVEVVAGSLLGLSLGAFLFEGGRGVPFVVNAASFGIAAVLIASIRVTARPPQPPRGHDQGGLRVGVRWLLDDQLLRTLAAMLAVTNFGFMLGQGIFVKYAA
ncbi:MAG TPA: MFS transporter, partial [Ilumatobacteraceae bacterium]